MPCACVSRCEDWREREGGGRACACVCVPSPPPFSLSLDGGRGGGGAWRARARARFDRGRRGRDSSVLPCGMWVAAFHAWRADVGVRGRPPAVSGWVRGERLALSNFFRGRESERADACSLTPFPFPLPSLRTVPAMPCFGISLQVCVVGGSSPSARVVAAAKGGGRGRCARGRGWRERHAALLFAAAGRRRCFFERPSFVRFRRRPGRRRAGPPLASIVLPVPPGIAPGWVGGRAWDAGPGWALLQHSHSSLSRSLSLSLLLPSSSGRLRRLGRRAPARLPGQPAVAVFEGLAGAGLAGHAPGRAQGEEKGWSAT